ncbi:MAG: hypothetical protein AB7F39_06590 [Variibacter sp.]
MRFKLPDNTIVIPGLGFAYGGETYGADWYRLMTDAQKTALGITEVLDDPQPDGRFYFVAPDHDNPGKWIATPKSLEQIKPVLIANVKAYVRAELSATDWMHFRAIDDAQHPVPEEVTTYRNAVRDQGNVLVAEIEAIEDFETLAAWQMHDWPTPLE